jgi:hypothetical protein
MIKNLYLHIDVRWDQDVIGEAAGEGVDDLITEQSTGLPRQNRIVFIEKGELVVTRCYLAGNATTATTIE